MSKNINKKVIGFGLSIAILGMLTVSAYTTEDGVTNDNNTTVIKKNMQVSPPITNGDTDPDQTSTCLDLQSSNLRYKSTDAATNGEVGQLQDFLISVSMLKSQATGFFGLGTLSAIKQFQRSVGLSPTGYVGVLTKAKIKAKSCLIGQTTEPVSSSPGAPGMSNGQDMGYISIEKCQYDRNNEGKACRDERFIGVCKNAGTRSATCGKPESSNLKPIQGETCLAMDHRSCPDGSTMGRIGCEWIPSSCSPHAGTDTLNGHDPLPPQKMKICPTYMVAQCQDGSSPRPIIGTCQFEACPETMPQGKACTMEVRLCPDGFTAMARDQSCGWHPESCPAGTGTSGMKCLVDSTTGKTSCGVQSAPTY